VEKSRRASRGESESSDAASGHLQTPSSPAPNEHAQQTKEQPAQQAEDGDRDAVGKHGRFSQRSLLDNFERDPVRRFERHMLVQATESFHEVRHDCLRLITVGVLKTDDERCRPTGIAALPIEIDMYILGAHLLDDVVHRQPFAVALVKIERRVLHHPAQHVVAQPVVLDLVEPVEGCSILAAGKAQNRLRLVAVRNRE